MPVARLPKLDIPGLSDMPVIGPLLFGHDALVYALGRHGRGGRLVPVPHPRRADPARGRREPRCRPTRSATGDRRPLSLAVLFGGAMAGLGGAYLSLAYTPMWAENMTAGRGWIALALVVFAAWRPGGR